MKPTRRRATIVVKVVPKVEASSARARSKSEYRPKIELARCFKCRTTCSGANMDCHICKRLFHLRCVESRFVPKDQSKFKCSGCVAIELTRGSTTNKYGHDKLQTEKLNQMLEAVLQNSLEGFDASFKASILVKLLWVKVRSNFYDVSAKFIEDIKHLAFFETMKDKKDAKLLSKLVDDVEAEVDDLEACVFCYEAKIQRPVDWFVQPCERRHEVIWAKVFKFPFWPAKVISKNSNESMEVLFFGDHTSASAVDKFLSFDRIPAENQNNMDEKLKKAIIEAINYIQNQPEELRIKYVASVRSLLTQLQPGDEAVDGAKGVKRKIDERQENFGGTKKNKTKTFTDSRPVRRSTVCIQKTSQKQQKERIPLEEIDAARTSSNVIELTRGAESEVINNRLAALEVKLEKVTTTMKNLQENIAKINGRCGCCTHQVATASHGSRLTY